MTARTTKQYSEERSAVATYKSTYDSLFHGDHRAKTILSTDIFVLQNGSWKEVASHSSELAK